MKPILATLLGVAALFLTGCPRHMRIVTPVPPVPHGVVVSIDHRHVHSPTCGHYYHGGSYYYVEGHHHGHGCGHVYDHHHGWTYAEYDDHVDHGHCCHSGCTHYHHEGRWYNGHRHGPGCGHALRGRIWVTID